jgi:NADH:ubiquinone oxidoreductase subunit F (NADH-binding)
MLEVGSGAAEVAALTGPLLLRSIGGGRDSGDPGLARHRQFWPEPARVPAEQLVNEARLARITGRGGADFPFVRKLQATIDSGRRRELVINGSEGEPASAKDSTLLTAVPHLVLDGGQLLAEALAIDVVHVVVPGNRPAVVDAVRRAVTERTTRGRRPHFEVHLTSGGFVGGQSRAVLELLSGRENLPVTSREPEAVSGLRGRPTLMSNAETFAHVAAVHTIGNEAYGRLGTEDEPGTRLLSVAADGPGGVVVEVSHGESLLAVLRQCGYEADRPVLIGGYHGTWLSADQVRSATISRGGLAASGARLGAGVILPMLPGDCPVDYTAQIVNYLTERRAQRCGPCRFGLPALTQACEQLARAGRNAPGEPAPGEPAPGEPGALLGAPERCDVERLRQLCELVSGRGACQHPDGTARLVLSMLETFEAEVSAHEHGTCRA